MTDLTKDIIKKQAFAIEQILIKVLNKNNITKEDAKNRITCNIYTEVYEDELKLEEEYLFDNVPIIKVYWNQEDMTYLIKELYNSPDLRIT